jgi:AcrR family transcriptional regulator
MPFVFTPPRPQRRTRSAEVPKLSRERIVAAAMRILDARGLDALSMRAVAGSLGTGPASLYAHVADKDELLELLVERVVAGLELPDPDAEHWQEQAKQAIRGLHYGLLAHRDLARACAGGIPLGDGAARFRDRLTEILRLGGLPDPVVAHGAELLPLYAVATSFEDGERFEFGLDVLVAGLAGYGRRASTA